MHISIGMCIHLPSPCIHMSPCAAITHPFTKVDKCLCVRDPTQMTTYTMSQFCKDASQTKMRKARFNLMQCGISLMTRTCRGILPVLILNFLRHDAPTPGYGKLRSVTLRAFMPTRASTLFRGTSKNYQRELSRYDHFNLVVAV